MNNIEALLHGILFFVLILLQVLVFNNMSIGSFVPLIYVLFVVLYPIKSNRALFLFSSFLLGLSLDIFFNSGGIHAASCVTIAYIRPSILKFSFGTSYVFQTIKLSKAETSTKIAYFSILIISHHLILFLLETFNFYDILYTLKNVLFTSIYTISLSLLLVALFSKKEK